MYDVIIIGAGPAGSAAAVQLAEQGHAVLLVEKKRYPVHKLCGEFLSTEVITLLDRIGAYEAVAAAGAQTMDRVRITTAKGTTFDTPLNGIALGLSRHAFDRILVDRAREAGAEVRMGTTVRRVEGSLSEGFSVRGEGEEYRARVVVGAFGKRSRLDGALDRSLLQEKSAPVAFKRHFASRDKETAGALEGTIELHTFDGGYCGLAPVEDGRINVCWIAPQSGLKAAGGSAEGMMRQVLRDNPALAERLDGLVPVTADFSAVAQISFATKPLFSSDVCMIGDAAAMIAPLCGDGMAMALRSASLGADSLSGFLTGGRTASDFRNGYRQKWNDEFSHRLRVGRWVHEALCRPRLAGAGLAVCRVIPPLGNWVIRATRG